MKPRFCRKRLNRSRGATMLPMRSGDQHGFTLIELMVALTLGLVVMAAAIAMFLSNKQAYITNNALGQVQNNSRAAFELLVRDIRNAGLTGCGDPARVANVLKNGPNGTGTVAWYADSGNAMIGYDGGTTDPAVTTATAANPPTTNGQRVSTTSSIELVEADGLGVSLASHNPSTATMTLNESSSTLATGSFIIVCDPNHSAIAQISSYTAGTTPSFAYASGSGTTIAPGNCSQGLGFPTSCASATGNAYQYSPNTQVSKLYAADWYIGYNPLGGTSLYRMTLVPNSSNTPTATAQEMVRNVSNMQITYLTTAGSFVTATNVGSTQAVWAAVNAVNLTLTLQSVSQFTGTNATTSGGNKAITRNVITTVTLRNRVQ